MGTGTEDATADQLMERIGGNNKTTLNGEKEDRQELVGRWGRTAVWV